MSKHVAVEVRVDGEMMLKGFLGPDNPAPFIEEDPYQTPEYQAFVASMVPHCHCSERNRPCDGLLAGGPCDGINDDDECEEAECDDEDDEY